jgi:phosphoglucosamine mutase
MSTTPKNTKLFGTDGIRGTSNQYPMTPEVVVKIGQAIGYLIRKKTISSPSLSNKVVIGKDTRLSGYMIEQALSSGLNSMGIYVQLVGPLPTPGIGYLTRTMRAAAGIVISASHNAYQDNGIKIFGPDGFKLDDRLEKDIESLVADDNLAKLLPPSKEVGRTKRIEDAQGRYIVYAKSAFPLEQTLDGLRIVLDTAHGAAYKVAPAIFEELGAEVIHVGNSPNGTNINDKVGALHPSLISQAVVQYRADVGIGLDGDADRVVMIDEKGKLINGDHILAICAIHMKNKKQLKNDTLVVTQMSNYGLEKKMNEYGIKVIKTNVGDKHVVDEMRKGSYNLGGEQSGHIIFLDQSTTGDGTVAALNVLSVMKETKKTMSELANIFEDMPQVLINCRVKSRVELENIKDYGKILKEKEAELKGEGRIFIRYSGTEPLIRILVEGPDKKVINKIAEDLASFLEKQIS